MTLIRQQLITKTANLLQISDDQADTLISLILKLAEDHIDSHIQLVSWLFGGAFDQLGFDGVVEKLLNRLDGLN